VSVNNEQIATALMCGSSGAVGLGSSQWLVGDKKVLAGAPPFDGFLASLSLVLLL
jgi:hypothetical protein